MKLLFAAGRFQRGRFGGLSYSFEVSQALGVLTGTPLGFGFDRAPLSFSGLSRGFLVSLPPGSFDFATPDAPTPEPASALLLISGVAIVARRMRRRT